MLWAPKNKAGAAGRTARGWPYQSTCSRNQRTEESARATAHAMVAETPDWPSSRDPRSHLRGKKSPGTRIPWAPIHTIPDVILGSLSQLDSWRTDNLHLRRPRRDQRARSHCSLLPFALTLNATQHDHCPPTAQSPHMGLTKIRSRMIHRTQ